MIKYCKCNGITTDASSCQVNCFEGFFSDPALCLNHCLAVQKKWISDECCVEFQRHAEWDLDWQAANKVLTMSFTQTVSVSVGSLLWVVWRALFRVLEDDFISQYRDESLIKDSRCIHYRCLTERFHKSEAEWETEHITSAFLPYSVRDIHCNKLLLYFAYFFLPVLYRTQKRKKDKGYNFHTV